MRAVSRELATTDPWPALVLEVDGTGRMVDNHGSPLTGYEIEDLKRLLAAITVASSEDTATWFDLRTAFGG